MVRKCGICFERLTLWQLTYLLLFVLAGATTTVYSSKEMFRQLSLYAQV